MNITSTQEIKKADVLVLGIFQMESDLTDLTLEINKQTNKAITDFILKKEKFEGKFLETYIQYIDIFKFSGIIFL